MKNSLCLIATLATLLWSCVEDVDTTLHRERKVVVNCLLTSAETQKLTLTYTNEWGKTDYDEVEEATATLFEEGKEVGDFRKMAYGEWGIDFIPRMGKKYQLEVQIPGLPLITASTIFPKSLHMNWENGTDKGNGKRAFNVENPAAETFWTFALEKPQDTLMYPVTIFPKFKLLESIGTDYPNTDDFNLLNRGTGEDMKYHTYIRMLPEPGKTSFCLYDLYSCVIAFRVVSDEYDRYLKSSLSKMYVYEAFDDPAQWFDESEIYSNVENGVGIFGAYRDQLFNANIYIHNQ